MSSIVDAPVEHFQSMSNSYLAESTLDDSYPVTVTDSVQAAAGAASDLNSVAGALRDKLATLAESKIHQTAAGYSTLRREAIEEAQALAERAKNRYLHTSEAAEAAILSSALPSLKSDSREALARQELDLALGSSESGNASSRVLGLAASGSPEVQACLATHYARTALIARGVSDVDRTLTAAKKVVVHQGTTPEALKSKAALDRLGKLGAGMAAAQAAMRHALPPQS